METIHLWCPSLQGTRGGIEAYSVSLRDALERILGPGRLTVLVRNDSSGALRASRGTARSTSTVGWLPKSLWTIAFAVLVVIRALWDRPDLIITTHLNFAPFAFFIRKLTRIPYWVVLHGYEAWDIQRANQHHAVAKADLLLPVSAFTRDQVMRKCGVASERMHLLHDTFDPGRFAIGPKPDRLLKKHNLTDLDQVILTVGRLSAGERYKGHDRMIRALPLIRAKVPRTRYIIVGSGDDQMRLEALVAENKVADCVIFAGRVPDDELPDYYRLCDVYAMPSTGEGFGIVFLEALATGKPVLAGNGDGATDALAGGELGLLVDPNDESALAETAAELLLRTHSHPLVNQPEQLRARAIERFGPDRFNEAVARVVREKGRRTSHE